MFKYTRAAFNIIIDKIKLFAKIFKYGSLLVSVAYYIIAIIFKFGYLFANIILLTLLVSFTIFEIATQKIELGSKRRKVKRVFGWSKIIVKTMTLGMMIYGMYLASTNVSPLSIILATLMIILWILEVLLEIISSIIDSKIDLVKTAFEQDMEDIKKPITTVSNVIKAIKGEEVQKVRKTSRELEILEERIKIDKEKKKAQKAKNRSSKHMEERNN